MRPLLHMIWFGPLILWLTALTILAWKIVERRGLHAGAFVTGARSRLAGVIDELEGRWYRSGWSTLRTERSGNIAFEEWRRAELARLERERRELAATHREFIDFVRDLRRAKDRDEFDRFMNAFKAGRQASDAATSPNADQDPPAQG
jgi:hypothetical protein